jgi:hypothetical protein
MAPSSNHPSSSSDDAVDPALAAVHQAVSICHHIPVTLDIDEGNYDHLHGNIQELVYCQQPTGFVDPRHLDDICLLSRSLYGLR